MDVEKARVLEGDDGGVHEDEEDVDDDQLDERGAVLLSWTELEELQRGLGVDDGEDDFLDGEADELDALEDTKGWGEPIGPGRLLAHLEDPADGVQDDSVDDDHGERGAQDQAGVYDQMESGPEDQGLARDHGAPSYVGERDGEVARVDVKDEEDVAQTEGENADRGDEEGPEVEAAALLEGGEAQDNEFDGIVPGDGDEAGNGEVFGYVQVVLGAADDGHWVMVPPAVEDGVVET